MKWLIAISVILLYVHLFNAIAKTYFASDSTMTWTDLYRRFVPPMSIQIQL